jgi:hypothetical protein
MKGMVVLGAALAATMSLGAGVAQANVAPTISAPASITTPEDTQVALAGFAFADADADGSDTETITLSVDSGTLSAVWGYVTTTGQYTSTLTMRGSLSTLQRMFSDRSEAYYRPANNDNGAHTLHVTIDDEGHSGGGALSASVDVPLNVSAVNDAPSISDPSGTPAIPVPQNGSVAFSGTDPETGFGRSITVDDVDDEGAAEQLTLSVAHGTLTLPDTTGLTFSAGDGSTDATMTFEGTLSDINAALAGLTYTPDAGYEGPDALRSRIDDLGNTGAGGAQTRTSEAQLDVQSPSPHITDVMSSQHENFGTVFRQGAHVTLFVFFNRPVRITPGSGHVPSLLLNTTPVRRATYVQTLTPTIALFSYDVQPGDVSTTLDVASDTALEADPGEITATATGYDATPATPFGTATTTHSLAHYGYAVDADEAYVTGVDVPADGRYGLGADLDFKVHFDRPVTVTSGQKPWLDIGDRIGPAELISGSGTDTLTFRHTVHEWDDTHGGGLTVGDHIILLGARIVAGSRTDPVLSWSGVRHLAGIEADGAAPRVAGTLHARDLNWIVSFNEDVTGVDASDFDLVANGNGTARTIEVAPIGGAQNYRVTLRDVSGTGTIAPRLKGSGTGIADLAGNALDGGVTAGQWALPGGVATLLGVTRPAARTPATRPATRAARPSLRSATIAASCTRSKTLTLKLAGRGAATVEVKVASLKANARQHGCSGLGALKTGKAVGRAKRLTLKSGTTRIAFRHGLKPGAYVLTFTPIAADGTRGTAVTRRIRILK